MSEVESTDNELVDLIVVRGTVCAGKNVKRGDRIKVPRETKANGVYPVRWWLSNRKAARTKAEFDKFVGHLDGDADEKTAK